MNKVEMDLDMYDQLKADREKLHEIFKAIKEYYKNEEELHEKLGFCGAFKKTSMVEIDKEKLLISLGFDKDIDLLIK